MPFNMETDKPLLELLKVSKLYPPDIVAAEDISMKAYEGEILFITGMSGAGKTTLLNLICCLEKPTGGIIEFAGRDISRLDRRSIQQLRQKIGVAYQDFRLLEKQSAGENIAMAMEVAIASQTKIRRRVDELLDMLNLLDKRDKPAGELSRGEQQRVAIARAAANSPPLILADEPTGNLDQASSTLVVNLFRRLNEEDGATIIIATHDESIYAGTDHRVLTMFAGRLCEPSGNEKPSQNQFREPALS